MTNQYYGSQSSDNFSHGYSDGLSSSESLTNPFTTNTGWTGYPHSSIPSNPGSAQFQYSQFGQANYAAIPVPQQQMMGYGADPSGALPNSKDKVIAAVLCWFLGVFGIHNFYTGHTTAALTQMILFLSAVIWAWFPGINIVLAIVVLLWPLVNFIQILTSTGIYRFDFPRI